MTNWLRSLLKRMPTEKPEAERSEGAELTEFFTDVESLLAYFHEMVVAPTLPKRLLIIHGVGGVGKSSLLRMFRLSCKEERVLVSLVSGDELKTPADVLRHSAEDFTASGAKLPSFSKTWERYRAVLSKVNLQASNLSNMASKTAAKTAVELVASAVPIAGPVVSALGGMGAEAFVDWLRGFLRRADVEIFLDPAGELTEDFLRDVTLIASHHRLVLMLDTYEQMSALDEWVQEFVCGLPANVLTVIAGREVPGAAWDRAWPGWMRHARIEELRPMSEDDMRTLVRRYCAMMRGTEPDPTQVEEIIGFARGLPLVVTTAVRLWVKYGVEDFRAVRPQVVADLVDRLMEGVQAELRPLLEAAASVRWFNKPVLRAVTGLKVPEDHYIELQHFPFTRSRVEGLALHDSVREIIDENLRAQDPERHSVLHEAAATYFEAQLEKATDEESGRLTLELLYHRFQIDEKAGIRLFCQVCEEQANARMVRQLRAVVGEVSGYSSMSEPSKGCRDYYAARILHLEAKMGEAESGYQAIADNPKVEPRLKAYALCDLGNILTRWERLGRRDGIKRASSVLRQSLSLVPLDLHLADGLFCLARVYEYQGQWDKAVTYIKQAYQFFVESKVSLGTVYANNELLAAYVLQGDWRGMFTAQESGMTMMAAFAQHLHFLRAKILGYWSWAWPLAGRCAEAERNVKEGLAIVRQLEDRGSLVTFLRNLGLALGMQRRYAEAQAYFIESLDIAQSLGKEFSEKWATSMGVFGMILTRQGDYDRAKECLETSLVGKEEVKDNLGMPEILVWRGVLHEAQREWEAALNCYRRSLDWKWIGRRYCESEALVGICRAKYQQGVPGEILPFAAQAEQLAQRYEYNDHLAKLRLIQGQIAWEESLPNRDKGFEAAQQRYQQALIHALRHNRFLLDEVVQELIAYCYKRGGEGQRMLAALHSFWQTGSNNVGMPRPSTISLLPEGMHLLEAEQLAREHEPGDGNSQTTVVQQMGRVFL